MNEVEKLKLKLRVMEISFEQINNSRNDMIKQLANAETIIGNIDKATFHAGCMGNPFCLLCPIRKILSGKE